jgi:hypothetical protein
MRHFREEGQILMEKWDARLFQHDARTDEHNEYSCNVVEPEVLESRRHLHQKVNELIRLANDTSLSTGDIRQHLLLGAAIFGHRLTMQLVRSLHRDDPVERQALVWLLTLLNDREAIIPLQHMSRNERLPRLVRLSTSLTLAGMGATTEMIEDRPTRLYAIS